MEGYFQKIVSYLLAVIIFFLFPVYITFEKKDDISHALVSKATHLFVDNVRSKGYISPRMYKDYTDFVGVTGNVYDIKFIHTKKRYDPVVYFYSPVPNGQGVNELRVTDELSYEEFAAKGDVDEIKIRSVNGTNVYKKKENKKVGDKFVVYDGWKKTTKVSSEIFSNDMIMRKLSPEFMNVVKGATGSATDVISRDSNLRKYKLAVGDNFEVSIRNKNTTIATMLFYTLTSQRKEYGIPRIYIKYGGVVRNEIINTILTGSFENDKPDVEEPPVVVDPEAAGANLEVKTNNVEIGTQLDFAYTGKEEKVTLTPGTYKITAKGAAGGGATDKKIKGGFGATVEGILKVEKDTTYTFNIGSKGKDALNKYSSKIDQDKTKDKINLTGGYNGGGNSSGVAGAGGGGATNISLGKSVILVAGGGGGNTLSMDEKYVQISAGGNTTDNLVKTFAGESACINRHADNYANDEAGAGAGYFGGKVIHSDNARCSYGGSSFVDDKVFTMSSKLIGTNNGNGSLKIKRIN
ncbi:MAG: glycine-rich protein [Clostridia bacterium]